MSSWYAREPGPQGQVINDEGDAGGLPLSDILQRGRMPVRAALELISYIADILTIAEEDRAFHGDLRPGFVKIQEGGTVALDGYGARRRTSRAPEGQPSGIATDVYGLGIILHSVLATEPMGAIPRDRDPHDDYIVDQLKHLDWGELQGKRWLDDVVHFLCSMLAHEPMERPAALDVANVLAQLSAQTPGEELSDWADGILSARNTGGGRQSAAPVEEDLGGPVSISGPVSHTQALRIRKAASAKGESTAFWSPDKIAALLAQDDEDDSSRSEPVRARFDPGRSRSRDNIPSGPPPAAPDSTYGAGAATEPPAPRALGRGAEPPRGFVPPPPPDRPTTRPAPLPDRPAPMAPPAAWAPAPVAPVANPPPPIARPGAAPVAAASPFASSGLEDSPPPELAPGGGGAIKVLLGVFVVLILLCLGVGGAGGLYYFVSRPSGPDVSAVDVDNEKDKGSTDGEEEGEGTEAGLAEDDAEATDKDVGGEDAGGQDAADKGGAAGATSGSAAKGSGTTSSGRSTSGSSGSTSKNSSGSGSSKGSSGSGSSKGSSGSGSSSGSTSGRSGSTSGSSGSSTSSGGSSTAKQTTTTTTSGAFPAEVKFSLMGKQAKLTCGDGQKKEFVGSVRMEFDSVTTCMMVVGDAKTAVTVRGAGNWNCAEAGGTVTCNP